MPLRAFEVSEGSLFGSINHITYYVLSKKKTFICIKCLSWGKSIFFNEFLPLTSLRKKDVQDQISSDILFMTITYPYVTSVLHWIVEKIADSVISQTMLRRIKIPSKINQILSASCADYQLITQLFTPMPWWNTNDIRSLELTCIQ